ncbi:NADH-quinone oxidoreductase subunit NuoN [Thioalkalivibrio sp. HK1]|uniref:NADH-quinone oxidoreductase subunit NuoN n=1 Tax=Thioalkalivibrio sp. HK1 TaxID=1469245 RepID=UPI0004708CE0|nr:NADH-quinone oxidoreductase subunit NuoN [Thioalkalivibrio sp. HK1]
MNAVHSLWLSSLPALAEFFLLAAGCTILVIDAFLDKGREAITCRLSQLALVVTLALVVALFPDARITAFDGSFVSDVMGGLLKIFILLIVIVGLFYLQAYLDERGQARGEYFVLVLFGSLGMLVMVSAGSFLTLYLGLELLSLSLYALVALNRESPLACEAAMKYFVLGALASGILLYGISMIYGSTGRIDFAGVSSAIGDASSLSLITLLGLVFVVVGIAFKFGAVPFHMWVPDVYEGAPAPITMLIATAPKIAAFGMLIRALGEGLEFLFIDWMQMLTFLAIASLAIGNVVAIAQTNMKRMLAYSAIAHVGFIFIGLLTGTPGGKAASMFYVISYALMALGAFGMVIWLGRKDGVGEADRIDDLKGIIERNPWFALMMLFLMLSMAGVPPFVGFWAKLAVLSEAVDVGMTWLAVTAVIFSVIGLFYYLRVVGLMFFHAPERSAPIVAPNTVRLVLSINALAIVAFGFYPDLLMDICVRAFPGLMAGQ